MSRSRAKSFIQAALAAVWLREGTVRRSWFGPYRGLRFALVGPGFGRLSVFYRAYEPSVTDWLKAAVQPGMTVYVVGAHVGIHVLYIANLLNGQGKVYAFEGWPENFAVLKQNIQLNPQLGADIVPVQQCVTRESGSIVMARGGSDGKHHIAREGEGSGETLEVAATSLDDFWSKTGACADLILIDIEGYELDALQGAEKLVQACKPRLILEHHGRADALRAWLAAHDYAVQLHDKRHLFTA
ncbi:MAG: FkbM family methyltransferase [Anaerolineae bacterium]|nr:FkbM family methyltransferase [Anaerolineae bacterium]